MDEEAISLKQLSFDVLVLSTDRIKTGLNKGMHYDDKWQLKVKEN